MSWSNQFVFHWHEFLAYLEKYLRKEAEIKDYITDVTVNIIIQTELLNWRNPAYPQGQWLAELQQAHPAQGQAFQATLDQLQLTTPLAFNPISFATRLGIGLAIALLNVGRQPGFNAPRHQLMQEMLAWLAGLFVLHQFLWPPYRHYHMDKLLDELRSQLGQTEQSLHTILAQVDGLK